MILSSLKRVVALTDARQISAAPILVTGPIETLPETLHGLPADPTKDQTAAMKEPGEK